MSWEISPSLTFVAWHQLKLLFQAGGLASQGLIFLFVTLQCIWVSNPRYKETIHSFPPPPLYHALFCNCSYALDKFWVQVSIRVLCSSHLNTALLHAGWGEVQWWRQCDLGVTVRCVLMALERSAFLQRSKVLFPAHGPVFSSPVRASHNWGLCSLWLSVLLLSSIYARRVQCCCRVWDDVNSLVQLQSRLGLIHCLSCVCTFC